jgi:hypothetical protein
MSLSCSTKTKQSVPAMKSSVALARNPDPCKLLENILEVSGVRELVQPDQRIVIKPNLVGLPSDSLFLKSESVYLDVPWIGPVGYMSRRNVVDVLIRILKELGGKHIVIAEGSGACETLLCVWERRALPVPTSWSLNHPCARPLFTRRT